MGVPAAGVWPTTCQFESMIWFRSSPVASSLREKKTPASWIVSWASCRFMHMTSGMIAPSPVVDSSSVDGAAEGSRSVAETSSSPSAEADGSSESEEEAAETATAPIATSAAARISTMRPVRRRSGVILTGGPVGGGKEFMVCRVTWTSGSTCEAVHVFHTRIGRTGS